ncbi:TPA: hypothetical protein N0F65_008206 [Lagenidium giganteum]|uniref:Uncharacterized protein n=1 Tax=Lagenidium giganteum TaxID=4803 RepID=A0AAV2Z1A7_9STRA|nr:TPA: hypothetical protein N0F65_008206 [Lagenidium giganteum]
MAVSTSAAHVSHDHVDTDVTVASISAANDQSAATTATATASATATVATATTSDAVSGENASSSPTESTKPTDSVIQSKQTPTLKKKRSRVVFEAAEIVEFEPTIYTTSVTSGGVPVGMSLKERSRVRRRLDSFELERTEVRVGRQSYMEEGYLDPQEREVILNNAGCEEHSIVRVEEEVNQIIAHRRESNEVDFEFMYGLGELHEEEEEAEEADEESEPEVSESDAEEEDEEPESAEDEHAESSEGSSVASSSTAAESS